MCTETTARRSPYPLTGFQLARVHTGPVEQDPLAVAGVRRHLELDVKLATVLAFGPHIQNDFLVIGQRAGNMGTQEGQLRNPPPSGVSQDGIEQRDKQVTAVFFVEETAKDA